MNKPSLAVKPNAFYFDMLSEDVVRIIFKNIFYVCCSMEEVAVCFQKLFSHSSGMQHFLSNLFPEISYILEYRNYSSAKYYFCHGDYFLVDVGPTIDEMMEHEESKYAVEVFTRHYWSEKKQFEFSNSNCKKNGPTLSANMFIQERKDQWERAKAISRKAVAFEKILLQHADLEYEGARDKFKDKHHDEYAAHEELCYFGIVSLNYYFYFDYLRQKEGASIRMSKYLMRKGNRDYMFTRPRSVSTYLKRILCSLKMDKRMSNPVGWFLSIEDKLKNAHLLFPKNYTTDISSEERSKLATYVSGIFKNYDLKDDYLCECNHLWNIILDKEDGKYTAAFTMLKTVLDSYGMRTDTRTSILEIMQFMASKGVPVKQFVMKMINTYNAVKLVLYDHNKHGKTEMSEYLSELGIKIKATRILESGHAMRYHILKHIRQKGVSENNIVNALENFVMIGLNCENAPWLWKFLFEFDMDDEDEPGDHASSNAILTWDMMREGCKFFIPSPATYAKYWMLDVQALDKKKSIMRGHMLAILKEDAFTGIDSVLDLLSLFIEEGLDISEETIEYEHEFLFRRKKGDPSCIQRKVPVLEYILGEDCELWSDDVLRLLITSWKDFSCIKDSCPEIFAPLFVDSKSTGKIRMKKRDEMTKDCGDDELGGLIFDLYEKSEALRKSVDKQIKIKVSYRSYLSVFNKKVI